MTRTVVPGLALMLAALSTLGPFSIDTFLPAMGAIGTALEASPLEMQQALSVYLFFYGGMMLWHGSISDAMGRRPVLMVATGLFACASIGCMLAQSLGQLLLFRALQGVCGGAGLIVGRAIIRDTFDGHDAQRLMSQVTMLFSLSPALAPVIGGWLYGAFGWRSIFAFMALVGLVLFVLCWRWLPETHARERRSSLAPRMLLRNYWQVVRQPEFRWLAAAVGELHRILLLGGCFLYPADARKGYENGRLRTIYEAVPIAFLIEQAGGRATDGLNPILDRVPVALHENTALIFGAADEVDLIARYLSHQS